MMPNHGYGGGGEMDNFELVDMEEDEEGQIADQYEEELQDIAEVEVQVDIQVQTTSYIGVPHTDNEEGSHYYPPPNYPSLPTKEYEEWQYKMRRTMQEIIPNLFLGPYASATRGKLGDMLEAGLTHVVCVRQDVERNIIRPNHLDHFSYHVVEFADTNFENIIQFFGATNAFINNALIGGGRVLVHGNGGVSRSAALVIAYVMSRYGVTCREAYTFVQHRRFCVNPNENFLAQLREFEPIYMAHHTVPLPLPHMEPHTFRQEKRSLEEDSDEEDEYSQKRMNVETTD